MIGGWPANSLHALKSENLEPYSPKEFMSAQTAAAIAQRALRGDVEPGFQTPARVYGSDFILQFPGVLREDFNDSIHRSTPDSDAEVAPALLS